MKAPNQGSKKWFVLLCAGMVSVTGCLTRRPPKATFGNYWNSQPAIVPVRSGADLDPPPQFDFEPIAASSDLAVARIPARPRVVQAPAAEPARNDREPEPRITPEFSAEELESAKTETQHNLELIDKNLNLSSGRSLNASQQDLASKVRGFADNARDAMKSGDWMRARNLAKKAEVLSEELAASL